MKPRVTLITLGVDDLERSLAFYRDGLGLKSDGIVGQEFDQGAVVFVDLQPGLRLALWPRGSLAWDAGLPLASPSPAEFCLGHNVASRAEVDAVMAQAQAARGHLEAGPSHLLGRLWGLLPGSGPTCLGSGLEPGVDA